MIDFVIINILAESQATAEISELRNETKTMKTCEFANWCSKDTQYTGSDQNMTVYCSFEDIQMTSQCILPHKDGTEPGCRSGDVVSLKAEWKNYGIMTFLHPCNKHQT